jgi:N-acyl homoserine lactone hydrolase
MTSVKRLYIFLCGYEILPKSASTKGLGERFVMSLPISAYLVETAEGLILIDTGFNASHSRDPELRKKYFGEGGNYPPPVVVEHHELLEQLKGIGLTPNHIQHVIMSHMHFDHTGNLKHFSHARISVQAKEFDHAFSNKHNGSYIRADYDSLDLNWHKVEGDWEIIPGLHGLLTPGHTPGHQSFRVELPNTGTVILTADAGDLLENFDDEVLPGETSSDSEALQSLKRLRLEAKAGKLILGHDPLMIQQLKLTPEYYD